MLLTKKPKKKKQTLSKEFLASTVTVKLTSSQVFTLNLKIIDKYTIFKFSKHIYDKS